MLRKLLATSNDVLPLVLRLTLGLVMFPHGAQKLFGWFGIAIALLIRGGGAFSVDRALQGDEQ